MSEKEKMTMELIRTLEKMTPAELEKAKQFLQEWSGDDPDKQAFAKALQTICDKTASKYE